MRCGCNYGVRGIFPRPIPRRGLGDATSPTILNVALDSLVGSGLYDAMTGAPIDPITAAEINAQTQKEVKQASGGNPAIAAEAGATPQEITDQLNAVNQQSESASTGSPVANLWDESLGTYTGNSIWAPPGQSTGSFWNWMFDWPDSNNNNTSGISWPHVALVAAAIGASVWAFREFTQ